MNPWLHSWFFSFLIVLLILGLLIGFSTLLYVVLCRIWADDEEDINELRKAPSKSNEEGMAKEPPIRKAAYIMGTK